MNEKNRVLEQRTTLLLVNEQNCNSRRRRPLEKKVGAPLQIIIFEFELYTTKYMKTC